MNGTFSEQLDGVAEMFEQWGACERTVVACALAKRVPWPGLRLLQRAVDAALRDHAQDERLEREANDESLLANLLAARSDDDDDEGCECLQRLLTLLPLLRTDNVPCKDVYVSAAPRLVQRAVDAPRRAAPGLCRQLLRYLLVHPALTTQDQRTLRQWLHYLETHMSGRDSLWQQPCLAPDHNIWRPTTFRRTIGKNVEFRHITDPIEQLTYSTDILQESFSKNGRDVDISLEGDRLFDVAIAQPKSQRSSSLTPPSTHFMHMSSSAENLTDEPFVQKPRSFSLSSEHSLGQIRPIIMYGTTGSETRLDDLRCNKFTEYPGMSTVAQWLKSLRLHKYVWLFNNISYEQMMAIDEEYLEKLGVTKGARHKLLLSIRKLSEREAILDGVVAELRACAGAPASAARALERLRGVLLSPMPPDSNLPAAIVRALETVLETDKHVLATIMNEPVAGLVPAASAARALERLRGVLFSPMPPNSNLPVAIVRALETASTCIPAGGAPAPAPTDGDEHVDPMSLHCWLVEKALHHNSFRGGSLPAALRRLRHRLPPAAFYRLVGGQPRRPKPRWRTGPHNYRPLPRRPWLPHKPPPPPRPKSHSYPPFPAPRPTQEDYSSLDALCLQMTEQAIN